MADKRISGRGKTVQVPPPGTADPPGTSFEEVYQLFYSRLVKQLTYLIGDRGGAEEVAQETFLKLYTVPPPTRENLAGWLYKVGARLAFNYLRGEKRRLKWEEKADGFPREVVPLEEGLWRQETVRTVRRTLNEMPDRYRMALLLRHTGLSYQEIARVLGVAPGSVGTILARAQRIFIERYRLRKGKES
ncbi:MAG: sigma-70 family RNA polymerase sigma factor [Bacillota bacterium]